MVARYLVRDRFQTFMRIASQHNRFAARSTGAELFRAISHTAIVSIYKCRGWTRSRSSWRE